MKKPTLTVAIPAYNEEANIETALLSIINQTQRNYILKQILVIDDLSNDKTRTIVEQLIKQHPVIRLVCRKERGGKARALNMSYDMNMSDYLLTVDADCAFTGKNSFNNLIKAMEAEPTLNAVGPRHVPVKPNSLMGQFAWVSYLSFEDAFLQYNNGYNFYTCMSGQLLRKSFAQSFRFPSGTLSDQIYLYAKATENNKFGFKLVKESELLFSTVSTFQDWRVLAVRSTAGDKNDALNRFGESILQRYTIPRPLLISSLVKWFIMHPILITGSIFMNIYVRLFPLKKQIIQNGQWVPASSSKNNIALKV